MAVHPLEEEANEAHHLGLLQPPQRCLQDCLIMACRQRCMQAHLLQSVRSSAKAIHLGVSVSDSQLCTLLHSKGPNASG